MGMNGVDERHLKTVRAAGYGTLIRSRPRMDVVAMALHRQVVPRFLETGAIYFSAKPSSVAHIVPEVRLNLIL